MSSRIYKNYQINVGVPFQIRTPAAFHTIQNVNTAIKEDFEEQEFAQEQCPEDIISSAHQEAELIIKEAQNEAVRIIEAGEKEARELCTAIEDEAWQKGYNDGIEEAKRQHEHLIKEAQLIKENARSEIEEVLANIEDDAVAMILKIARNVIGTEVSASKENILYIVKQAFEKCTNREKISLRVSNEEYDFVSENKDKLMSMIEGISELDIKRDGYLNPGACIVDTPFGSVDAGVDTKLKKIEDAFMQLAEKSKAGNIYG